MYNAEVQMEEISLGEDMEVLVLKGKGDSIISRVIVNCKVSFIAQNYIIVDPISPPDTGVKAIKLGLDMVSDSDNWELAIMSQAVKYLIEQLEELS
jgi:hypothetical protein